MPLESLYIFLLVSIKKYINDKFWFSFSFIKEVIYYPKVKIIIRIWLTFVTIMIYEFVKSNIVDFTDIFFNKDVFDSILISGMIIYNFFIYVIWFLNAIKSLYILLSKIILNFFLLVNFNFFFLLSFFDNKSFYCHLLLALSNCHSLKAIKKATINKGIYW